MFSSNSVVIEKLAILAAIESVVCVNFEKYLGLPVLVGRKKTINLQVAKGKNLAKTQ